MGCKVQAVTMLVFCITFVLFSPAENYPDESPVAEPPSTSFSQPPSSLPMNGSTPGSLKPQECGGRCASRCSNTQYKKPCLFFCNKCCAKCLCVPPGTYGNKEFCPCYNNWKTKRGGPKCP